MKYYIVHYTKNTERRALLEAQLKDYNLTDVEWIEEYDREDPRITHIKEKTKSPLTLAEISCSMKHFEAMKRMVDQNIEEAVILEDDVIFYPEFGQARFFHSCGFLRLGLGVGILDENKPPRSLKVYIASNPGGSEAQWVSLPFAKAAIENMSFDYSIDMFQYALLHSFTGEKLRCMNLCYQTSLVASEPSEIAKSLDWDAYREYCIKFKTLQRYKFEDVFT